MPDRTYLSFPIRGKKTVRTFYRPLHLRCPAHDLFRRDRWHAHRVSTHAAEQQGDPESHLLVRSLGYPHGVVWAESEEALVELYAPRFGCLHVLLHLH